MVEWSTATPVLAHHRFEVAIADGVAAVSAHRPQHNLTAEMPSLESFTRLPPPPSHCGQCTIPAEVCNRATWRAAPSRSSEES